jgi:hypothetical protein
MFTVRRGVQLANWTGPDEVSAIVGGVGRVTFVSSDRFLHCRNVRFAWRSFNIQKLKRARESQVADDTLSKRYRRAVRELIEGKKIGRPATTYGCPCPAWFEFCSDLNRLFLGS